MAHDVGHARGHKAHELVDVAGHEVLARTPGEVGRNVGHLLAGRKGAVDAVGHEARIIELMNELVELVGHLKATLGVDVANLVAGGVAHHAGMRAVLAHERAGHLLPAVREVLGKVAKALHLGPHVADLVEHVDTLLVAGGQKLGRGMVVGAADGIEARLAQPRHTPALKGRVRHASEDSLVVVNAGTTQKDGLPVDQQAMRGVPRLGADARADGRGVLPHR